MFNIRIRVCVIDITQKEIYKRTCGNYDIVPQVKNLN